MTSMQEFRILAGEVYQVDIKESEQPWKKNDIIENRNLAYPYKVLKTEDNTSNGMQAMAVAPVKDGTKNKADTSEVVIAYAGTNFGDMTDINTDLQNVIIGNEEKLFGLNKEGNSSIYGPYVNKDLLSVILGGEDLYGWGKVGELKLSLSMDSQISTAEQFANRIKVDYPNADITTTGHLVGEFLALDVAAENQWKNVGFNGPDPYHVLSPEAKQRVEENSNMLFNYRKEADMIGNLRGNGTGAGIPVDMDEKGFIKSHQIDTWDFDEEGNVEIDSSNDNREAFQTQAEKLWYGKMTELTLLANKLQASGGGLSSNELILLN